MHGIAGGNRSSVLAGCQCSYLHRSEAVARDIEDDRLSRAYLAWPSLMGEGLACSAGLDPACELPDRRVLRPELEPMLEDTLFHWQTRQGQVEEWLQMEVDQAIRTCYWEPAVRLGLFHARLVEGESLQTGQLGPAELQEVSFLAEGERGAPRAQLH